MNQRKQFHDGDLCEDRVDLLNDIGFTWKVDMMDAKASLNQRRWDEWFTKLQEYRAENGHVHVEDRYRQIKGGLGKWLRNQRQLAREGTLDSRRLERLQSIGVVWNYKQSNGDDKTDIQKDGQCITQHTSGICTVVTRRT